MAQSASESAPARERIVVVVDPYSSGRFILDELKAQQWPIVGIQSSQELAGFWLAQFDPALFVKTISHRSLAETLDELKEFDVAAVMPGSEPGVLLAEELQDSLELPGNGSATKEWRRHKFNMQERLREMGIRAIHQLFSSDIDEILAWQAQWGKWPIIVKPAMSGGTDGVHWCHSEEDVRRAHEAECGKLNVNGVVNDRLLVQEYLDGPEYIVDCVSHEGKHVLSGIWIYKKTKDPTTRSISYEWARMIESTGPEQDVLLPYVFSVLDALSIKHGPSHTEVIITSDGPCLVETGARMHGAKGPLLTGIATGFGTHELAVDVAVNGARVWKDLYAKSARYTVKKWVFETFLLNKSVEGSLARSLDCPEIRACASVTDVFPSVQPGEELKVTRDLATSPGLCLQVHPSLEACFADVERIRELERTMLYQVKDPTVSPPPSPRRFPVSPMCSSPKRNPSQPVRKSSWDDDEGVEFQLDGLEMQ